MCIHNGIIHVHIKVYQHTHIYSYTHIIRKEQIPRISSKLDLSDGDASAQRFTQRASLQPRLSSTLGGVKKIPEMSCQQRNLSVKT